MDFFLLILSFIIFKLPIASPLCIPELSPRCGETMLGLPVHLLVGVWVASSFRLLQLEPW